MSVTDFGLDRDKKPVHRITFESPSGKLRASLITYGATLQSFQMKKGADDWVELTLGFDKVESYVAGHLGATCGRVANRIGGASFHDHDGNINSLPANNNGQHTLHGGPTGYSLRTWDSFELLKKKKEDDDNDNETVIGVVFKLHSPHLDNGFPAALDVTAKYYFAGNDSFVTELSAANVDKARVPAVVNLTNHAYWNLSDNNNNDKSKTTILRHTLHAPNATFYVPVADGHAIPTGEIRSTAGTAFDFRGEPRLLGERIDDPLLAPGEPAKPGYDHCLILSGSGAPVGCMRHAATLSDPESGRSMSVETTLPAVQLYTGNFLADGQMGHGGVEFGHRAGVCLETQFLPDSPNHPHFPSTVVKPGEVWHHVTRHTFFLK